MVCELSCEAPLIGPASVAAGAMPAGGVDWSRSLTRESISILSWSSETTYCFAAGAGVRGDDATGGCSVGGCRAAGFRLDGGALPSCHRIVGAGCCGGVAAGKP